MHITALEEALTYGWLNSQQSSTLSAEHHSPQKHCGELLCVVSVDHCLKGLPL